MKHLFNKNDKIGQFSVLCLIKTSEYTQTYRVKDKEGNSYFLKLYLLKCVPDKLIDKETNTITEILVMKNIQHTAFPTLVDSGSIETSMGTAQYLVTEYFKGNVLAGLLAEKKKFSVEDAIQIYKDILVGLQHLHAIGYCHNDITPANIMVNRKDDRLIGIIDMGHTSPLCIGRIPFDTSDLDAHYCANSCFVGSFTPTSDLFSATAVLYTLLSGTPPWPSPTPDGASFTEKMRLAKAFRKENLLHYKIEYLHVKRYIKRIIAKGLGILEEGKYSSAEQILQDFNNTNVEFTWKSQREQSQEQTSETTDPNVVEVTVQKGGNGFADIAGMHELKELLTQKVIFVLKNEELAKEYKLTPPNGLLLYGPPGCGKTFFAEKFAEETGFNYMLIKSSDLASIYIHGSQQKIGELFKRAEANAPTVICFDEFDALVPNRSNVSNTSESGEVNEFLSQLNNCAARGIFVIATSNRPDMIDPSILRTGRIDKHIYVPMPDQEARQEMFRIHLKGRPYDEAEINLEKLAKLTEGYIASDIAYIVNDAAMVAAFTHSKISQEIMENSIRATQPSIQAELVDLYIKLQMTMEGNARKGLSRPIGFHIN